MIGSYLRQSAYGDLEGGPKSKLTLDLNFSSHFLDDLLANTEAKSCASLVLSLVLLEAGEIQK